MNTHDRQSSNRRQFLKYSAQAGASVATLAMSLNAHAASTDDELRIGLVGCGNRGTGAVRDALLADPRAKLVALGDAFADRAESSLEILRRQPDLAPRIDVAADHVFSGFDAYKQVVDSDVHVVLHAAPPHFRPTHFAYSVSKGRHNFVEKPVAVDVPGLRTVQAACEEARRQRLSVVSGLCYRYHNGVKATVEQVAGGAIGDIVVIESTYNAGSLWHRGDRPDWSRMEYQMRNWLYYTWLSGDHIVEQAVHTIDKAMWLLGDAVPISAWGVGGRQQRTEKKYGNVYDHHTVFYEFPNDVRVYFSCRQHAGTTQQIKDLAMGTKGRAELMSHDIAGEKSWRYTDPVPSMYRVEHEHLFRSIRNGEPIDNGHYMCNSTMAGILGRLCTYSGQRITWEEALGSQERLGPEVYEFGDVPEPPVAIPGVTRWV